MPAIGERSLGAPRCGDRDSAVAGEARTTLSRCDHRSGDTFGRAVAHATAAAT